MELASPVDMKLLLLILHRYIYLFSKESLLMIGHYFLQDDFSQAVSDFCKSEKIQIENYIEACKSYTPFNKDYRIV